MAGRAVDERALQDLAATGALELLDDGNVRTRPADLELALELPDVPVPREMLEESTG